MFKPVRSMEVLETKESGNFISKSGMYPVTILAVIETKSKNGSMSWDLFVDYEGNQIRLYDAIRLTNTDGTDNFQINLAHKLCAIAEIESEIETESMVLPAGKKGAEETFNVYSEFAELPVVLRIQMEYSLYNDEIREKRILKNIFRAEDLASADEIVNNAPKYDPNAEQDKYIGKQYAIEDAKGHTNVYKNELTEEQVNDWIKKGRGKNNTESKADSTPTNTIKSRFARK